MEIRKEDIARIRAAFDSMRTKEDLLSVLNEAKPLLYGPDTILFELRQLAWYANTRVNRKRYTEFRIAKSSGKERTIHAPVKGLKAIQRTLAFILQCVFEPHRAATGFVRGRSIVDNAKAHAGNRYVYNIDLKDFFPSIDQARIWKCLQLKPFNLNDRESEYPQRLTIANIIAALCCAEMDVERMNEAGDWVVVRKNVLPQGAPTSPVLSNVVCQRLDHLLSAVAKHFGLRYTRYADDITFSSMHNVYKSDHGFVRELHRVIADQHFCINSGKTRLQKEGYRQEVTGLVVNERANVHKRYIRELRMWLYYWERYGYNRAAAIYNSHYPNSEGISGEVREMSNVLAGKIEFITMVRGKEDGLCIQLKERYKRLAGIIQHEKKEPGKGSMIAPPLPHDPVYTARFLKKFKTGDGSGFKELVHDIDLSGKKIDEILDRVKTDPNFIYNYKREKVKSLSFLNRGVQLAVVSLIDSFASEGRAFFERTGQHPYNNDDIYTKQAIQFKRNYRYGSGNEYSHFLADLLEVFTKFKIPKDCLDVEPSERIFNVRASFFTWKPSLLSGIRFLVEGIRGHSNINEDIVNDFKGKRISIELVRKEQDGRNYLEFAMTDHLSKSMSPRDRLLEHLTDSAAFLRDFRGLCDWIVECDFGEDQPPARLNLLVPIDAVQHSNEIETLASPVGGFRHILRFYDGR